MSTAQTTNDEFRAQVRAFFAQEYPRDILAKLANGQTIGKADLVASEQALAAKGWLAPGWPAEYGGPGWNITQRFIFDEEMGAAGAPSPVPMGLLYVAPIIYTFGTQSQKDRWLGDILASRTFWAQGYSEPEAGSDLASLRTSAVRDTNTQGDDYIVNGEKIWTSQGHYADWIFCLVRTDSSGRKQEGITFLCIDMRTPGVVVTPIISIDGGHYLNRVSFTDVRVPAENRIGEEGLGWTYARHLLSYERTSYARVGAKWRQIAEVRRHSAAAPWGDILAGEDSALRSRLADTEIALTALEYTTLRALAPLAAGQAPGQEASTIKIAATETGQAITERLLELAGPYAAPFFPDRADPDWREDLETIPAFAPVGTASYLFERAQTIYGGSTEVQKNIIAKQLGL